MPRKKIDEWVSAPEVLKIYQKSNGGQAALKRALAEHVRDGNIRTRGVIFSGIAGKSAKSAWTNTPERDDGAQPDEIPVSKWRASKCWAADQDEWRWPVSNFSVSYQLKPRKRTMVRGVEFCGADLKKMLHPAHSQPRSTKAPNVEQWRDFYFAVIRLAQDPGLTYSNFRKRLDLMEAISKRMTGDEFGETYMRDATGVVYQEFVEPTSAR